MQHRNRLHATALDSTASDLVAGVLEETIARTEAMMDRLPEVVDHLVGVADPAPLRQLLLKGRDRVIVIVDRLRRDIR
jgi:hypothetical protein